MNRAAELRAIPSVDRILQEIGPIDLPRAVVTAIVRRELAAFRAEPDSKDEVLPRIRLALDDLRRSRIGPVINATGIIVHTNFGRAPLGKAVCDALTSVAGQYTNLEYDLTGGRRGGRAAYLEHNLAVLFGADAATVVNNCAAALLLALHHFTLAPPKKRVIISRGELVQIGGGFRIHEILQASGAELHEIGATNKTTMDDYRNAIGPETAMILKVHQSNFYMDGFVSAPSVDQIAAIAKEATIPLMVDIGSGAVFDTTTLVGATPFAGATAPGAEREPMPLETLKLGADLVCCSGDKLLGGPQAGILAGNATLIAQLKRDPLFRALRCDKLILAALQTTVDLLLANDENRIPIRAMMSAPIEPLRERGQKIIAALGGTSAIATLGAGEARIGGGAMPRTAIPSVTVDLAVGGSDVPNKLADALRRHEPPVIGYVAQGLFRLDLRTVFESQDAQLIAALHAALGGTSAICAAGAIGAAGAIRRASATGGAGV